MSNDWVDDIHAMHSKFGVHEWVKNNMDNPRIMSEFMKFRMNFIREEFNETINAAKNENAEEIVDGLIDICVVAIGTLDAFGVDAYKAWDEINRANMSKEPGIKESRPNPLGLPDLMKPDGWVGPSHENNHGIFDKLFIKDAEIVKKLKEMHEIGDITKS